MSNKLILITGCQRSGTTLVNLILDSHSMVKGVDEAEYEEAKLNEYLNDAAYAPYVALKLPTVAHLARAFKNLPQLMVLWCVRDPRDVIVSMLRLNLRITETEICCWANHPAGAFREIENCLNSLANDVDSELLEHVDKLKEINKIHPLERTHSDAVFTAAMCWRLKNQQLDLFQQENVAYKVLRYEDLISSSESVMHETLAFLDLPWSDDVLRHHELHSGTSIGCTDNTKPIDAKNMCKWKGVLCDDDLSTIQSVCADVAKKFDYQLTSD